MVVWLLDGQLVVEHGLLAASALLVSIAPGGERLEFRVERGATAHRTFQAAHEMQPTRRRFFHDGHEIVGRDPILVGPFDTVFEHQQRSVTDEILEECAGQPMRVARSLGMLEVGTGSMGELMFRGPEPHTSALEGRHVLLEWSDETNGFSCTFIDGPTAGEPVLDCVEDMDLRGFLPTGEVEPGDRWELQRAALQALLCPGGELGLTVPPGPDWAVERLPSHLWIDQLEGHLTATFSGSHQQEGERLGKVDLAGEITTSALRKAGPDEQGLWTAMDYRVRTRYELRGELLWDLEGRCLRSLRLEGPCKVEKSLRTEFDWMGMPNVTQEELELEGTSTFVAQLVRE
jgi:hypothetical protein